MKDNVKGLIAIHFSVLLMGFPAIVAKALPLPPSYIVLCRVFFATLAIGAFLLATKTDMRLSCRRDYCALPAIGALLAFHWSCFFAGIKYSTVAIGLLTCTSYPIFVTFLEPIFFREKLKIADVISSFVMFFGVALIVPGFDLNNAMVKGYMFGLAGAVSYAFIIMMNRKFAQGYSGTIVNFYELGTASLVLLPQLLFYRPPMTATDWLLAVVLGVVFTGLAHSLFVGGMKYVRAQTAGVIMMAENLYGILLAALIFGEIPSARVLLGGCIMMGTALSVTLRSSREK